MFFWVFSPFLLCNLLAETQDEKAMENKTLKVTMTKKNKISKVSEFLILAYTWNGKLGNLGKFSFTFVYFRLLFGGIKNSRSKNQKNDFKQKIATLRLGLIRKNENFKGFQVFDFALHLSNPHSSWLRKFADHKWFFQIPLILTASFTDKFIAE